MTSGQQSAQGLSDLRREDLYDMARDHDVEGRSGMTKDELVEAVDAIQSRDALQFLQAQHDDFRARAKLVEDLKSDPTRQKQVIEELIADLVRHGEIEEQVFYPAIRRILPDLAPELQEGIEEHHVAEVLMFELVHKSPDAERFSAKAHVLLENLEHHLDEEETDLFTEVRKRMSQQDLDDLGEAMRDHWHLMPSRPRPYSPATPPGNVLFAIPARMIEWISEATRSLVKRLTR